MKKDDFLFQFAVISDSHIRLQAGVEEGGYVSNRLTIERANYVVQCVNALQPNFVVHLGDLVHPIPALSVHEEAVEKAAEIFAQIEAPFYVLAGNHDIGDKPNGWLPAPVVEEDSHLVFAKHWGSLTQSFTVTGCHFICLDTSIMNSGFAREHVQRIWLENELRDATEKGLRIIIFMHYPLFICDPDEPTHYDNIDQPARDWHLQLFKQHGVEALFSGHVHNVFVGIDESTTYYSVPSMAFVRPEYSELATIGPGDEYGRNDAAKLGFFLVRVYANRHEVLPIRTYGAGQLDEGMTVQPYQLVGKPAPMLGVTLRRGWGRRVQLAVDGLDEFQRKEAYRDGLLIALLELGVTNLRVPFADLAHADVRQRLADFVKLGFAFTVFSLGIPNKQTLATMRYNGRFVQNWELIFPERIRGLVETAVKQAQSVFAGQLFIAPVIPIIESEDDSNSFQHFASHGFSSNEAHKAESWLAMIDNSADDIGVTFRVSPWNDPITTLREIEQHSKRVKLINLQLPRLDEGVRFKDDQQLQSFIVNAYNVSRTISNTTVFIDTFVDSDRGYYPRIGLLDRRSETRFLCVKISFS